MYTKCGMNAKQTDMEVTSSDAITFSHNCQLLLACELQFSVGQVEEFAAEQRSSHQARPSHILCFVHKNKWMSPTLPSLPNLAQRCPLRLAYEFRVE